MSTNAKKFRQKLSTVIQYSKKYSKIHFVMETETFASRLKDLRKDMELTQSGLAEKIGASQRQVSFWEKGQIEPNIFWLIKLADFFDVTIDYLVGRNQE